MSVEEEQEARERVSGGGQRAPASLPRRVDVRSLLEGHREVLLEHDGQLYHLRVTANGKLILTK